MATASERAAEINVRDVPRGFAALEEDDVYWMEVGVNSGDDLDAYLAYSDYVDLSKDVYGWKDRRDWRTLSAAGWDRKSESLREGIRAREQAEEAHKVWARDVTSCAPMTFSPFAGLRL
jgi:hypothetical protein